MSEYCSGYSLDDLRKLATSIGPKGIDAEIDDEGEFFSLKLRIVCQREGRTAIWKSTYPERATGEERLQFDEKCREEMKKQLSSKIQSFALRFLEDQARILGLTEALRAKYSEKRSSG